MKQFLQLTCLVLLGTLGLLKPSQAQELNPNFPPTNGTIYAIAHDNTGNTYIGGAFSALSDPDYPFVSNSGIQLDTALGRANPLSPSVNNLK